MTRMGRKPLAAGHVDRLEGSELARLRMRLFLETMMGEVTIPEACRELGVCESRFHAHRHAWLQEALTLLEPRRTGRPPNAPPADGLAQRFGELEVENRQLRQQLQVAEVREQLVGILPPTARDDSPPIKKRVGGDKQSVRRPR